MDAENMEVSIIVSKDPLLLSSGTGKKNRQYPVKTGRKLKGFDMFCSSSVVREGQGSKVELEAKWPL
jgi:hypothetical protein